MSAIANGPPRQIFLRPIGSPLALGMSGLVIASLVESGLDLHWLAANQTAEVGLILVAVPFLLQGLASVLSFLARDGASGAAVGVLATSWLAIGLVHITSPGGQRPGALGLMLLASSATLVFSSLVIDNAKPLLGGVFAMASIRFVMAGIYELGAPSAWRDASGIAGLAVVCGAWYCVLAFELEAQEHRTVLPTFRRGRGRAALTGAADVAMDDVVHEPGVRQTT